MSFDDTIVLRPPEMNIMTGLVGCANFMTELVDLLNVMKGLVVLDELHFWRNW